MKKRTKRVLTILGAILISIVANLLTPENKTITKIMKEVLYNFSLISFSICAIICMGLIIKWKIEDFLEAQNNKISKIQSYLIEHKNAITEIKTMASYKALDEPLPIPKTYISKFTQSQLKDINL